MAARLAFAILLTASTITPAVAQAPADFYRGRKMDMVIGYTPAAITISMPG